MTPPLRLCAVAVLAGLLPAQGVQLVRDINATLEANPSSFPQSMARLGPWTLLQATTPATGAELWRTDGTPAGTQLVADIEPGVTGSLPHALTPLGAQVLFVANTAAYGAELWRSDGTAAGTTLVADIRPGPASANVQGLVAVGGLVYFQADDGQHGSELWRSDGTAQGTFVLDLNPGSSPSFPRLFTPLGARMVFAASGIAGNEPWVTDGTTAGTLPLGDLNPGAADSTPDVFVALGNQILFAATTPATGRELWRTDGTPAGTTLFLDVTPGASGTRISAGGAAGGVGYFAIGGDLFTPSGLWRCDGTPAGTIPFPVGATDPMRFAAGGSTMYFVAFAGGTARQLWRSDGTVAGTLPLTNLPFVGPYPNPPAGLTAVGSQLFFVAQDQVNVFDLWTSDGTVAGTRKLPAQLPDWLIDAGGTLLFAGLHAGQIELLHSDGTAAGTGLAVDIAQPTVTAWSDPKGMIELNGAVFFTADDGVHGRELWRSDGTTAGTVLVADLVPGPASLQLGNFVVCGGRLLFTAYDGVTTTRLWQSDGTAAGTSMVPGLPAGAPRQLLAADRLVFFAMLYNGGDALWRSDGTAAGTFPVAVLLPNTTSTTVLDAIARNGQLWFAADDGVHGRELWTTDGTVAGTRLVKDILPGVGSGWPTGFVALGDALFFAAGDGAFGVELWRSDGTEAGTVRVTDINPGPGSAVSGPLVAAGGRLFFGVQFGTQLWQSDGSAAGTTWLATLPTPGFDALTAVAERVFFRAQGELWVSDGTVAGTHMVVDLLPGPNGSQPQFLTAFGSRRLVFSASESRGRELWATDGTVTQRLADLMVTGDANPSDLLVAGGALWFAARQDLLGRELWCYRDGAMTSPLGTGTGTGVRVATLRVGDPVLGQSYQLDGSGALQGAAGVVLFGLPATQWLPLPGAGAFHLEPLPLFVLGAFATAGGQWNLVRGAPDDASLDGGAAAVQAFLLPGDPATGFDASNGVRLRFGR